MSIFIKIRKGYVDMAVNMMIVNSIVTAYTAYEETKTYKDFENEFATNYPNKLINNISHAIVWPIQVGLGAISIAKIISDIVTLSN
jgi:hypothetical protein